MGTSAIVDSSNPKSEALPTSISENPQILISPAISIHIPSTLADLGVASQIPCSRPATPLPVTATSNPSNLSPFSTSASGDAKMGASEGYFLTTVSREAPVRRITLPKSNGDQPDFDKSTVSAHLPAPADTRPPRTQWTSHHSTSLEETHCVSCPARHRQQSKPRAFDFAIEIVALSEAARFRPSDSELQPVRGDQHYLTEKHATLSVYDLQFPCLIGAPTKPISQIGWAWLRNLFRGELPSGHLQRVSISFSASQGGTIVAAIAGKPLLPGPEQQHRCQPFKFIFLVEHGQIGSLASTSMVFDKMGKSVLNFIPENGCAREVQASSQLTGTAVGVRLTSSMMLFEHWISTHQSHISPTAVTVKWPPGCVSNWGFAVSEEFFWRLLGYLKFCRQRHLNFFLWLDWSAAVHSFHAFAHGPLVQNFCGIRSLAVDEHKGWHLNLMSAAWIRKQSFHILASLAQLGSLGQIGLMTLAVCLTSASGVNRPVQRTVKQLAARSTTQFGSIDYVSAVQCYGDEDFKLSLPMFNQIAAGGLNPNKLPYTAFIAGCCKRDEIGITLSLLQPHLHISDSLVMADSALKMAEAGCQYSTMLEVDFLSETVQAILALAGFAEVGVYRMSDDKIKCSLADATAGPDSLVANFAKLFLQMSNMTDQEIYGQTVKSVPATKITGFLGSMKATLLNYILPADHGKRIAVIKNEFGAVDIYGSLVAAQKSIVEYVVMLNNDCLCCTVRGDLVLMLSELVDKTKGKFDHVVRETTGLANPSPIIQTIYLEDPVFDHVKLDGVVTLVDAKHARLHLDVVKPNGVVSGTLSGELQVAERCTEPTVIEDSSSNFGLTEPSIQKPLLLLSEVGSAAAIGMDGHMESVPPAGGSSIAGHNTAKMIDAITDKSDGSNLKGRPKQNSVSGKSASDVMKVLAAIVVGYAACVTKHVFRMRKQYLDRHAVDRPGNILPGPVVDTKLCHPTAFAFYLCSQSGFPGTRRLAHYTGLWDENQFSIDEQVLTSFSLLDLSVSSLRLLQTDRWIPQNYKNGAPECSTLHYSWFRQIDNAGACIRHE